MVFISHYVHRLDLLTNKCTKKEEKITDWTYYSKINNNETLLDYLLLLFFLKEKRELRYYQSVILGFIVITELKSMSSRL